MSQDKLCEHGKWLGTKWCCLVCFNVKRRNDVDNKKSSENFEFEKEVAEQDQSIRKLTQL